MRSGDKILFDMVDTDDDGVISIWQETDNEEQKNFIESEQVFFSTYFFIPFFYVSTLVF